MASALGINSSIGIALSQAADTYGVAEAVTEKLVVESMSWNENAEVLESAGIGSGGIFSDNAARGNVAGSLTIEGIVGYDNGFPLILAQFLGTSGTPTETTSSQGDYAHQITAAGTINDRFLTIAAESSTTTVIEFPSVTVTDLTITAVRGDYLRYSATCLFDELVDTSPTNNNAALDALTLTNTELCVVDSTGDFQMNSQAGGALSGSDRVDVTQWVLNLSRPQSFIPEINATAANGSPVASDKATGTLQVTIKDHGDNTYETAAQAGTEYKSLFTLAGTQIGSGTNHSYTFNVPRQKLLLTPEFGLSSAGLNQQSLTFQVLEASSNPTGMDDTTPYVDLTNQTSTDYTG